jgi:hypothetical protein
VRSLSFSLSSSHANSARINHSIHQVHDEAKDKDFELELSWIAPASGWKHVSVPKAIADAAGTKAKE